MKKVKLFVMAALMLLSIVPMPLNAVNVEPAPAPVTTESVETRVMNRITEIKAMDRSKMTSAEKKNLRKELREMKHQMKALNGGVYLSVGAIIIILLILILIL
jgi:hypothetical protein